MQWQRPAIPCEVVIFEMRLAATGFLHNIQAGTNTPARTADGKVTGVVDDIIVILHHGMTAGLTSPLGAGQRITENIGLFFRHLGIAYIKGHVGKFLFQEGGAFVIHAMV